jgi:sirohydrochlorin ferrochelatase
VLAVAHGSRAKGTEAALDAVVAMVMSKLPGMAIECAFMQFSDRTLEKGVQSLIAKGVTEIKIVPYFLFMGVHMKEDIPRMAAGCAADYPDVEIRMGDPLGIDERLADILVDRIAD